MKKKILFNKKANSTFIFVSIIITLLGFFIMFNNLINFGDKISSYSEDLSCRSYISMKDSKIGDALSMLRIINFKCKKDELKIKSSKKDEVFKKIADESRKCWFKYGSGKSEFMQSFGTNGNWCFTCAEINFKDKSKIYKYNDFINWISNNKVKLSNGTKVLYSKTFNMKYTNVSESDLAEMRNSINEIKNEKSLKDISLLLMDQYSYIEDLKVKKIDTNYKTYIVYRYDKLANKDSLKDAKYNAYIDTGVGIVISSMAESVLWSIGSFAVCGATGAVSLATMGSASPLMVVCFAMTGKTIGKIGTSLNKFYEKSNKILSLSRKIKNTIKSTNKIRELKNSFKLFTGSVKDIELISKGIKDTNTAEKLLKISKDLEGLGINNIGDISKETLKTEDKLKNLVKITDEAIDLNMLNNPAVRKLAEKESSYYNRIEKLKILQKELKDINYNKLRREENLNRVKNYLDGIVFVASGIVGYEIGSNVNTNSNQYVDILTEEQYYRLCGTLPGSYK